MKRVINDDQLTLVNTEKYQELEQETDDSITTVTSRQQGVQLHFVLSTCLCFSHRSTRQHSAFVDPPFSLYQCRIVAQWRSSKALDLRSLGHGFNSHQDKAKQRPWTNCSQLCASVTSSITWYWSKDGDVLRVGR